jgi:predicted RNase H-like HicB family nuclease
MRAERPLQWFPVSSTTLGVYRWLMGRSPLHNAAGEIPIVPFMKLHVVIDQDEAGYYVAEVPALPGCLSQGKTQGEALTNVKEAIEGWLEVMEAKSHLQGRQTVEVVV